MLKSGLLVCLLSVAQLARADAALTPIETKWLRASTPVLNYAARHQLPIDIIVQPQAGPNDVPMAMGFDEGRCKLVLSMRGNAQAESVLQHIDPAAQGVLIEAMAAHEVAHCWRYAHGVWHALPAGFVETGEEHAASGDLLAAAKAMRENRREEGYGDLVALAWTRRFHPADYARVYAWLATLRADQPVARNTHDTRPWIRLADRMSAFATMATPFDDVGGLWSEGLLSKD